MPRLFTQNWQIFERTINIWTPNNLHLIVDFFVEINNFLIGCPLTRKKCLGALALSKTKHTGLTGVQCEIILNSRKHFFGRMVRYHVYVWISAQPQTKLRLQHTKQIGSSVLLVFTKDSLNIHFFYSNPVKRPMDYLPFHYMVRVHSNILHRPRMFVTKQIQKYSRLWACFPQIC